MSANAKQVKKMRYQANHVHTPGTIKDVFDGSHYQSLLNTIVPGDEDNPFLMNVTLPLAFWRTVLLHSRNTIKRVGLLYFSTTISLPKYASKRNIAFTLPRSRAPKSLGIGTRSAGHLFKNCFNWSRVSRLSMQLARDYFYFTHILS